MPGKKKRVINNVMQRPSSMGKKKKRKTRSSKVAGLSHSGDGGPFARSERPGEAQVTMKNIYLRLAGT